VKTIVLVSLVAISFFYSLIAYGYPKDCIVINIPSRTLDLYKEAKIIKTYPVGVGRSQFPTPIGDFKVITMVKDPGWENPYRPTASMRMKSGQDNPLGTRWIGFKADSGGEYGIHGTDNSASVGKYSSHGCVRMNIKDAENLFDYTYIGMPVIVTYDTVRVCIVNSQVLLINFPDVYKLGKTGINTIKEIISNLNTPVLWDATIALKTIRTNVSGPVKIGTVLDANDLY